MPTLPDLGSPVSEEGHSFAPHPSRLGVEGHFGLRKALGGRARGLGTETLGLQAHVLSAHLQGAVASGPQPLCQSSASLLTEEASVQSPKQSKLQGLCSRALPQRTRHGHFLGTSAYKVEPWAVPSDVS